MEKILEVANRRRLNENLPPVDMGKKRYSVVREQFFNYWREQGQNLAFMPSVVVDEKRKDAASKANLLPWFETLEGIYTMYPELLREPGRIINADEVINNPETLSCLLWDCICTGVPIKSKIYDYWKPQVSLFMVRMVPGVLCVHGRRLFSRMMVDSPQ